MAFRSQKTTGAFLILLFTVTARGEMTIPLRHVHLRKGGAGEIRISEASIAFREAGKKQKHSREWAYDDIQQFWIAPNSIRILTYEDVMWKLGSDREYEFDQLPNGAAARLLNAVRPQIDERRLVSVIPAAVINPVWQVKAKLLEGRGGPEGIVLVGDESIVFKSDKRNASRTWQFGQIDNVSSSGPFDLTITTSEKDRARFSGRRDFRFQLKAALDEKRYNALWRRLNESRLSSNMQAKENPHE